MEKRIIILAKSNKFSGYCVAGFDIDSKKYIRLVPKNEPNTPQTSLLEADLRYSNNKPISVLDIVKCTVVKQAADKHQTENWVLDVNTPKEKLGTVSITELGKYLSYEELVFYSTEDYVKNTVIDGNVSHSIEMILVSDVKIYNRYGKIKADFTYKGNKYTCMSVTDPVYMVPSQANSSIKHLDNAILVITLPHDTYGNDLYYKIVASVFALENKKDLVELMEYKVQALDKYIDNLEDCIQKYETERNQTKQELKSFITTQVDFNALKEFSSTLFTYKYYPETTYKILNKEKVKEVLGENINKCFEEKTRKAYIAMKPLNSEYATKINDDITFETKRDVAADLLSKQLKDYRTRKSIEEGMPAYIVFWDKALQIIVDNRNTIDSLDDMLKLKYWSNEKVAKYGEDILSIIHSLE